MNDTPSSVSPIIGVKFEKGDPIDPLLAEVAEVLKARGVRVAGLIQTRGELKGDCSCADMRLHNLATGGEVTISENRGPESMGCHLDWQAITIAAGDLEQSLTDQIDVLFINRFGESESDGKGFRSTIEKAIELGIQVIVAYRSDFSDNWAQFHGGFGVGCGLNQGDILALVSAPSSHETPR